MDFILITLGVWLIASKITKEVTLWAGEGIHSALGWTVFLFIVFTIQLLR